MFRLDDVPRHFMGRDGGRDEDDFLELEGLPNFLCTPEMTQMYGIEGPSKQTNPSPFGLLLN
jgi:hypothetical protein